MTSSIINWIVDKYLSNILEINQEETKSSLWSGEFEMSNLKIKPEIFTNMNLPYFELVHGYVGKMKISLSLPRFYLYPIKVEIDKVYFHAKQKKLETLNKKTEIENMETYKNNQLQSIEELVNEVNNLQSEGTPGMTSQIINNLEININDICIRFDDELSYNLIPFSFGLLLKNIKIKTVDKDFNEPEEGVTIPFGEINNKIVQMTNLSMYLDTYENEGKLMEYYTKVVNTEKTEVNDEKIKTFLGPLLEYYRYCLSETNEHIFNQKSHQYLVFNLGFLLKLSMNENLKNGHPQYEVDCKLNDIIMSMSLVQIKAAMKLLAYQDLSSKYQLGLSKEYYIKVINEEEKLNYIENYIEYFRAKYGYRKNEQQVNILKPALSQIENGLKYEDIQIMRDAAKYKMFHDKEIDKIDEKIQTLQGGSGFWSYFSSGPTEEQKKEIEELEKQKQKLIEENVDEGVKERLKKINQNASNEVDTLRDVPDSYCLYKVNLTLPKVTFDINRQGIEKMITMEFKKFNVVGEMRKKGQFFSLLIDDIFVRQYQLKGDNVYETLMASIEQKNDKNIKDEKDKQGALYIEFENNPIFEKSNFRFKFRNTKRLVITMNLYSIQYILNKVLESLATTISKFGSERYIGTGEIQNLIKSGFETNYISGGYQHFNIDLDIVMKSPIILYPQDILDNYNRKCLFIRCGDFEMTSILPPRQDLKKNYEQIQDRAELFDIYSMKIENFCMATLDDFDGDFRSLATAKGLNLVDDITVNFVFEQMFETKNKFFEKMKIFLKIGKCKFNLRDTQVIFFIELLEKMQRTNKELSFELENKTLLETEEEKQNKEDAEKEENEKREKAKKAQEEEENRIKAEKTKKLNKHKQKQEEEEKQKKNEEEKLKRLKENEDPPYLIFEFILENVELCLIKSISLKERNILSEVPLVDFDKNYRDFIVFNLNQFAISVLTTEKGNMNVDISMESTGVIDKETIILSKDNPKGDSLINKEFQDMIQMYSRERRPFRSLEGNNVSRSQSGFLAIAKEQGIEIVREPRKEDDNQKKKFMMIEYRYNGTTKSQEVNIVLQKIRICFSMSAMARLYQYYNYYYGMYCQSNDDVALILANMEEKHKKDKLKQKLKYEKKLSANTILDDRMSRLSDVSSALGSELSEEDGEIQNIVEEETQKKKLFGKKFAQSLSKDLKALGEGFENNIIDTNIDKEAEESINKKKEELSKIFTTTREKSNMKINFQMKETMVEFPLDDTKSKTKVLRFNFNFICSILMDSEYDLTKDGTGRDIKYNYLSNNMKLCAKFINIGFSVVNFKNGIYSIENICDQMLQGFRFITNINSFLLLPHREKSVMAIDVIFEPLIFNIGFRQTKTILGFLPKLSQFLTDMYKEYDDPLKELNKKENEDMNDLLLDDNENNNIINENPNKINDEELEENLLNLSEEELEKRQKKNKKKIEKYKIKQKQLEQKKLREKKKKELQEEKAKQVKATNNTDNLNNMIDVNVVFNKFSFKFLDDSGAYLIPLLNIETRQILVKYIQNSNTDSVENISNLILESIARKEIPLEKYDIKGLGWYIEVQFDISINFYNDRINNWEPIIERYSGVLKVDQVTSFSRMRVYFNSDDFFNMNISISSMNVLNRVLKKFGESEEKWDKELNEITDVAKNKSDRIAVEFLNLSGIEIECWLDANELENNINDNKLHKYILDNDKNNLKSIGKRRLTEAYQHLSEAQLKIKKDKFSFRIRGYVPVYNNDFSSNYTTSFRMKKEKLAKNEVKSIYSRMKKNTKPKQKNENKEIKDIKHEPLIPEKNIEMQRSRSEILTGLLAEDEESLIENDNEIDTNSGMKENNNIQVNDASLEDELEILVKIRQNGNMKSIVFQSNIFIFNNLQIPICLSFISPKEFRNTYNSKDDNINHLENKNKIILNTCKRTSIPINYILNKYRVYVCFHNKLNEAENKYSLLYENFSNLKQNLPNFIKYNEENSLNFKGIKETILQDNYSKIIEINQSNKNFYISSNLIIQRGTNDIIKDMPQSVGQINKLELGDDNDLTTRNKNIDILIDSLKHDFYCKTFSYLFILDESLMIENKIPFNVRCKLSGSNDKEMIIRPLQKKEFLDINQTNTNIQISMNYQNKKFISEVFDIKELDNKNLNIINTNDKNGEEDESTIKQIKLFDEENKEKYVECNLKFDDNLNNVKLDGAYEREYEYCLHSFQNKKKILFYSRCIVINKSDYLLYILGENEKKKEKDMNQLDNYNYKIMPHSINLINTKDVKQTFRLKSQESEWSEKFNINTVGNTGVTSLNVIDKNNNKTTILDIGVSIPTSWYFTNSLLINIEPRFLFVNKLGFDIEYKQYNNKISKSDNDKSTLFEKNILKNNESVKLSTLKANKNMKKMIQIKFGNSPEFSCPVDLEEMGDVDLKIPIDENMKNIIDEKNKEIDKEIKKLKKLEKKKKKEEKKKEQLKKEEIAKNIEKDDDDEKGDDYEEMEELISTDTKNINNIKEQKNEVVKKEEKPKELSPEEARKKRIDEKNKKFEEKKMKLRKYITFQQNYQNYLLVHLVKSAYGGLIYIVLFPPEYPQYIISNESKHRLTFKQKKDEFYQELFTLERNESIPYIWGDSLKNEKLLIAMLDKNQVELNLNEIKIVKKQFDIKEKGVSIDNKFYFQTIIENNKTRKLIIKNEDIKNKNRGYFLQVLRGQKKSYNMKFKITTKGLGLSIISNEPKEIFYISAYGWVIDGQMFTFKKDDCDHSITNVRLILKNLQIDYCLDDNFKSMIIPVKQITPQSEEEDLQKNEQIVPLFQGIISYHSTTNPLTQVSSDEFPQLDFTIQPFKFNLSQYQLMSMLTLYNEIMPELDFFLSTPEPHEEYNNIEDFIKSIFDENANKTDELIYDPEFYDPALDLALPSFPEEVIYESENHWMFFIKNIAIGSLDIVISTRIDLSGFGEFLPSFLMGIISAIGNVFTHITDYHLKFTSFFYMDVFTDVWSLSGQLTNNYISQLKRRLFKIVGSLDILGNPTGYASAIGDGFMQIIEAPRKGLINGPLGFGEGIAKGFGTFITTVISSSFDVVGKITGTLLSSCEALQGTKVMEQLEEREPEHVIDGLFKGLKEGVIDLSKGIGGIFYKTYDGAKEQGVKGFFFGLGSGLLGAVVSPFTAGFRVANNLFVGLKNTANIFNPKLKSERFRYPRTIEKSDGLKPYDEDKATIQTILDFLKDYSNHEIIHFKQFKYISPGLENSVSSLILTDKCIIIVYQAKEVVFKLELNHIKNIEVHKEPNQTNFDLIFYLKDNSRKYIRTNDINVCSDIYLLLEKTKE